MYVSIDLVEEVIDVYKRQVMKQDDVVDDLFDKVKAELIDFIREHPEDGEQAEDGQSI